MRPAGVTRPAARAAGRLDAPAGVAALALLAVAAFFWWPELTELAARWAAAENESHGWLIAAAVPVLIWLARDRIVSGGDRRALALAGLLLSAVGYAVARAASIDLAAWLAIPFTVYFGLWIAFGWHGARALAFPIGYFLFAVPFWGLLTPVFQSLTVAATTLMLAAFGLQAHIVGEFVTVPAGTFEIAGGCSGMNYVVVALATGSLLAWLERLDLRRTALLVAVALAIAMVANWLRVAIIIYVGNATAMQSSLVEDHAEFGWWVFAAVMLPYFWFARRVANGAPPVPVRGGQPRVRLDAPIAAAVLALALAPAWGLALTREAAAAPGIAAPEIAGWEGPEAPPLAWRPAFPGALDEHHWVFRRGPESVEAYAAVYAAQSPGRKLIGYFSSVAGEGWSEHEVTNVLVPGGDATVTERVLADTMGNRRIVWSWYDVRGRREVSAMRVKLLEGLQAFGWPRRSGVLALSARCVPDCAAARAALGAAHEAGLGRWTTNAR